MPKDDDHMIEPGWGTTEFLALVIRHVVAVAFVVTGAICDNQHSSMLIVGGLSLLGVDAGFYTFSRTWAKAKARQVIYQSLPKP